jgi:uncharacterized OB-fold protein
MDPRYAPVPMPESRQFWDGVAAGELRLPFCVDCDEFFFYPRVICPRCYSAAIDWRTASGRGRVASFVIAQRPVTGVREEAPFTIALIDLEEGPRLAADLVGVEADADHVRIGLAVELDFERDGDVVLPVFRPREVGS